MMMIGSSVLQQLLIAVADSAMLKVIVRWYSYIHTTLRTEYTINRLVDQVQVRAWNPSSLASLAYSSRHNTVKC